MKILLLAPPGLRMMNPITFEQDMLAPKTWVPLGVASLTAVLRVAGFDVSMADLHDAGWEDVERVLAGSGADVVGISFFTFGRVNAMRTASLAKQTLPGATVIAGGPHATFFPGQVLSGGCVDIVVMGEGESTLVELVAALDRGADFREVPGIAYRQGRTVLTSAHRAWTENLDAFPFPSYEAFDLSQYKSPEIPACYQGLTGTHVITSRGCPFTCRFCSVNRFFNGRWAFRSPRNVVDELESLVTDFGVRHVYFSDDLFTLRPERAIGICKEILDRRLELVWMAETRVDCVDGELLDWMRRAGCYRIYYGVESGSPKILQAINKRFTVRQVAEAFEMTHRSGIEPCCFLMVGNPGETPQTIAETVALVNAIRPAALPTIGIATILPGTDLYELSKHQELITDDYWMTDEFPPLYTGEYDVDGLIMLQMMLTKGTCPELYDQLCDMGFDEGYFRLRKFQA